MLSPTSEQHEIITAAVQRQASLMINALAGTGKTTTLQMLASVLPKEPILALAFNKKIKEELEKRFPPNFTVMTMNGLGHRAWGKTINKPKMLIDDKKLGRLTTAALKAFPSSKGSWNEIRQLVVYAMQRGVVPTQFQNAKGILPDTPDTWQNIASDYDLLLTDAECKLSRRILCESIEEGLKGVITYDDQIYLPVVFPGDFPRFNTVLVDEAQDLSPLNHQMLRKCAAGRLIVVGDPRQAIYAFRGADSSSMDTIKALRTEWIELPLNTTFRCPLTVVERQHPHAPNYVAAPSNPQGAIYDLSGEKWTWDAIPAGDTAVLCRNNAPLISIAFKLIRQGIGVNMLGREIGKGLSTIVKKLCPDLTTNVDQFLPLLTDWYEGEKSKAEANGDSTKAANVTDKYESIIAVISANKPRTVAELIEELNSLFAKNNGQVILATGHKAKGLEWDNVIHLDPWRIPSKYAKTESEQRQEANLRYVLETRTKHTLILANLSDFEQ